MTFRREQRKQTSKKINKEIKNKKTEFNAADARKKLEVFSSTYFATR